MFKFIFKEPDLIKTAAKKNKPVKRINNAQQQDNEAKRREAEAERKQNQEKASKVRADLDKPFGVLVGDLDYHPVHAPHLEPPRIEVVHGSLPEYRGVNKMGQVYSRGLKTLLRNHRDWQSVTVSRSLYGGNKDLVRIAPDGLEVFRPRVGMVAKSTQQYIDMINQAKSRYNTRQKNKRTFDKRQNYFLPITNFSKSDFATSYEVNPEHPSSLIATKGRRALSAMVDVATQNAPFTIGQSLCVCGSPHEDHVTPSIYGKEYENHLSTTGRRLMLHGYMPQQIQGRLNAVEFQYPDSPMLKSTRVSGKDENGKSIVAESKAFDMGDDNYIPMVKVGTRPFGFKRFTNYLAYRGASLQNLAAIVYGNKHICKDCKGTGVYNSNQRENSIACDHCSDNKVRYIDDVDSNGDKVLRPYTVGLGNGEFRYLDPKDAPECTNCWGQGHADGIECGKCRGTGRNMTAIGCQHCNSNSSILKITPDNTCFTCQGKKIIETGYMEKRKYPKSDVFADTYEGNPTIAVRANLDSGAINTGAVLWKGHRDPNCKVCTHDHYADPDTGLPCECRIARPDDDRVLPSNIKVVTKDGIYIPQRHFQAAMRKLYGEDNFGSPHESFYMPDLVSPETGKSPMELVRFGQGHKTEPTLGDDGEENRYVGITSPGFIMPAEVHKDLLMKSAINHASPTAKWTAASADLESVLDALNDLPKWSVNIPTAARTISLSPNTRSDIERRMTSGNERINTRGLPQNLRQQARELEGLVSSLPDAKTGRYNTLLDDVYESHILSNHKDPKVREVHMPRLKEAKDKLFEAISTHNPNTVEADTEQQGGDTMPIPMAPHLQELTDILSRINPRQEADNKEQANV